MKKNTLIELLKLYMQGKMNATLQKLFREWLAMKADHEDVDEVLEDYFNDVFTYHKPNHKTYNDYGELARKLGFPQKQTIRIPFYKRTSIRVAAVLIPAMIALSTLLFRFGTDSLKENTPLTGTGIEVAEGDFRQIQLPDGSIIIAKGASSVTYANDFLQHREVFLQGEAFFKVQKNQGVPFLVKTRYLTVEVTGTEFNVQAPPEVDKTIVSLVEGSVNVTVGKEERSLLPPQQLELNHTSGKTRLMTTAGEADQWWTEPITFRNQRLDQIFSTIGNYYDVRFTGIHSLTDTRRYNIKFDKDASLSNMLDILKSYSEQFDFSMDGQTIIITNK